MDIADIIKIVIVLGIGCTISFIAIHFWIFFWDLIIGGIKKLLGIKKKTINWHTIDNKQESKTDIQAKKDQAEINDRLY